MDSVFLLWHQYEFRDSKTEDLEEDAKFIGVYRDRVAAQQGVERLRGQPGFRDYPEGFLIEEYALDKDHWTEGFITESPASDPASGETGPDQPGPSLP